jgi:two-component system CheB/CheR fusion protein
LNRYKSIDCLFRSIAETQGSRSGGIILSGMLSDGVEGLKFIKDAGGVTFAQAPDTAAFNSMPQKAIQKGCVDFVLTPETLESNCPKV